MGYGEERAGLFGIGEFSKVVGLTVKALRFYHEQGILTPAVVDPQTGYRYYDRRQVETARVISYLRKLEVPVGEIRELLGNNRDEAGILDALEKHKATLEKRVREYRRAVRTLGEFIAEERRAQAMTQDTYEVGEKVLEPVLVGGVRMKGRYSECGKGFAQIGRRMGRRICGKPMLLHYDEEYREDDADFEACMPVRPGKTTAGISVRELAGGRCVWLVHKGPYEQLGHSYAKILGYVKEKGYRVVMPTREVYLKGPGMIFRGNPANYLTEIQMVVEGEGEN